ncbi:MAG: MOSC domain-containing protein [Thermoanaerobaculia bacterium]
MVGKLAAMFRYPVKSMGAETVDTIEIGWNGLAGDRRWAFVRDGMTRSGFPWLTIRENPAMWGYRPRFVEPTLPEESQTVVLTPSGRELDVIDPALAEEVGRGSRVIKQSRGIFDTMPLSVITTRTVAALSALVGEGLGAARFRPNLVIEPDGDEDFPEDEWVGKVLRVGGMTMRVDKRDKRCVMVNVNPQTTEKNPDVLRAIARERAACLGVYGTTVAIGRVEVGDTVEINA